MTKASEQYVHPCASSKPRKPVYPVPEMPDMAHPDDLAFRQKLETAIEGLVALLDHMDGDTDREPDLDREGAAGRYDPDDELDRSDWEPCCEDEGAQCDDEGAFERM